MIRYVREDYVWLRGAAIAVVVTAVVFAVLMWTVFAPAMIITNLTYSVLMLFPISGLLWVAWTSHRSIRQLDRWAK